jgi:hypothetical protein
MGEEEEWQETWRHYNFISFSDVEKDISPEKLIKNGNSLLMMFSLLVHLISIHCRFLFATEHKSEFGMFEG